MLESTDLRSQKLISAESLCDLINFGKWHIVTGMTAIQFDTFVVINLVVPPYRSN